jgi:hypothetical protein
MQTAGAEAPHKNDTRAPAPANTAKGAYRMSRVRLIMLSLFAIFATSAVASASASAARTEPCEKAKGPPQLCIEGKEAGSPNTEEIPFTSKKKAATKSRLTVTGGPIIECAKAANEGQFEATETPKAPEVSPEISDLIITFSECKVVNNAETEAKCEVGHRNAANEFIPGVIIVDGGSGFGTGDRLDGPLLNTKEVTFAPSEGTLFTKIAIKSKTGVTCPVLAGNFNVTGTQTCTLPESEVEKAVHGLVCAATGSKLKFGENAATFELEEEVELTTKEKFSIIESAAS